MIPTFTGGIAETNAYLLDTPSGKLLIDAPEGILQWLKTHQQSPVAVFLTHQHFDHVMDAAGVQSEFGCPIFAWRPHSKDLTLESLFNRHTGAGLSVPIYRVDHVLEGMSSAQIAGIDWTLFRIPGHSPDSVCIYNPATGDLFGGDVLFAGGVGRSDFPGGSHAQLIQGIEQKLLPLPDQTLVHPGHGPITTIGEERDSNPYLS